MFVYPLVLRRKTIIVLVIAAVIKDDKNFICMIYSDKIHDGHKVDNLTSTCI